MNEQTCKTFVFHGESQRHQLLTWVNFNPCMDKWPEAQQSVVWIIYPYKTSTVEPFKLGNG